jgi:hypothetical protein
MKKIFGIGWAKTGTTSLGVALDTLGFNHRSQDLNLVEAWAQAKYELIFDYTDRYDSFDDWPWLLMYEQFNQRYPDAKFVLTIREETTWLRSYESMLADQGMASEQMNVIRSRLYGLDFPNVSPADLVGTYRQHNEDIMSYFADKPGKLLVADWSGGHGYPELCSFLGLPVLEEPFPHANKAMDRKVGILRRTLSKLRRR